VNERVRVYGYVHRHDQVHVDLSWERHRWHAHEYRPLKWTPDVVLPVEVTVAVNAHGLVHDQA
jgi:hypothetical protein